MAQQPVPIVQLTVEKDNKLVLHYGPSCFDIVFMLPVPFLCVGCCISKTVHVVFDDTIQIVNITQYPGFCFPLKTNTLLEYSMIANVAYRRTNLKVNNEQMFEPVLVTHKGEQFPCGSYSGMYSSTLQNEVLAVHRFVFGRQNQDYHPPNMRDLVAFSGHPSGKYGSNNDFVFLQ